MKKVTIIVLATFIAFTINSCKKDEVEEELDPIEEAYKNADGLLGGKFYDLFWKTRGYEKPVGLNIDDIDDYPNFYQCEHCHGWDLMGKEGIYINKKPLANRPKIAKGIVDFIKSKDKLVLFNAIKNEGGRKVDPKLTGDGTDGKGDEHPDYGKIFNDKQIWDIVKFLREDALKASDLFDIETEGEYPTGTAELKNIGKDGDEKKGKELYAKSCDDGKSCHGAKGDLFDVNGKNIGDYFRKEPYILQHKVKFGNPGKSMPDFHKITVEEMKNLLKAGQDEEAFPSL